MPRGARTYAHGLEPNFQLPEPAVPTHRFALGNVREGTGSQPLVVIGMNPSHASGRWSDATINRVIQASIDRGYAGWLMLNLYPERSPSPAALGDYDAALSREHCDVLAALLERFHVTEVLIAWGNLTHPTLKRAKLDVLQVLADRGIRMFTYSDLTVQGEPRHPSPRRGGSPLSGDRRSWRLVGGRLVPATG